MRIDLIVGARPNFVKAAPVYHLLKKSPNAFNVRLIHTGQHYDTNMSDIFFQDLDIPTPDLFLGVGSGEHGIQTGKIMMYYEKILLDGRPDLVLVFGDVNSTMACALVAVKEGVKVGHVEAGLRSFDRTMPEEINRLVTDAISDILFTPSSDANRNLHNEGIPSQRVHLVGNVMIDSLVAYKEQINQSTILRQYNLKPKSYAVLTLHRPGNVDYKDSFVAILQALKVIQEKITLVFPVHPRTRQRLFSMGFNDFLQPCKNLLLLDPLGYRDFLKMLNESLFVMTDSGGVQEESTFLGIPCLTLRENTERPITVKVGTNVLVGKDTQKIIRETCSILAGKERSGKVPTLWDGKTAERIVDILQTYRGVSRFVT